MGLRELAYRLSGTTLGEASLRRLVKSVPMSDPFSCKRRGGGPARYPFLVVVTVDTEGGYVEQDERRRWQGEMPDAFEGYVHGVRNLVSVLAENRTRATFLVSTHALSSSGSTRADIERELAGVGQSGHEIGLHLHAESDRALAERVGGAGTLDDGARLGENEKRRLLETSRALLTEALGEAANPVSFRWGGWGLDASGVRALRATGFRTDSSAIPGCRDLRQRRNPRFDWHRTRSHEPWWLDTTDHQATDGDSGVLEIPIATCGWLGRTWRADPLFGPLLEAMFVRYYESAPRDQAPLPFVLMTHSSEATKRDGSPTRTLADLAAFLSFAASHGDVEFVTLEQARDQYLGAVSSVPRPRTPSA